MCEKYHLQRRYKNIIFIITCEMQGIRLSIWWFIIIIVIIIVTWIKSVCVETTNYPQVGEPGEFVGIIQQHHPVREFTGYSDRSVRERNQMTYIFCSWFCEFWKSSWNVFFEGKQQKRRFWGMCGAKVISASGVGTYW